MGRLLLLAWLVPAFLALQGLEAASGDALSNRCGVELRACVEGRMPRLRASLDWAILEASLKECARSVSSTVEATIATLQHGLLGTVDGVAQSFEKCAEQTGDDDDARGSCLDGAIRAAVGTLTDGVSKQIGSEVFFLRRDVAIRLVQCVSDAGQAAAGEAVRKAVSEIEACALLRTP